MAELGFQHVFLPGAADRPLLLLLHGTGADENDLVDLGRAVSADSAILSPRGKVLENGMPRFFRRLAEGVFDLDDLYARTDELAAFIGAARAHYGVAGRPVIALGFSNGANIAASLLLRRPESLDHAILIRAMTPYRPDTPPDLRGKKILMLSGLMDPVVPVENAETLAALLKNAGAGVDLRVKPASHGMVQSDMTDMAAWISGHF